MRPKGACDQWFIDDGQAFVQPHLADCWLQAVDRALHKMGSTRGEGDDAKSRARLLARPEDEESHKGWDTEYIRRTCKIDKCSDPMEVLGAPIGTREQINVKAQEIIDKTKTLHGKMGTIGHAATEMVLTRQ